MRLGGGRAAAAMELLAATRAFFRQGGSTLALCPMVWVHVFLLMKYGHRGTKAMAAVESDNKYFSPVSAQNSICCLIPTSTCALLPSFSSDTSESFVLVAFLQLFSKGYATIDPSQGAHIHRRSRKRKPTKAESIQRSWGAQKMPYDYGYAKRGQSITNWV